MDKKEVSEKKKMKKNQLHATDSTNDYECFNNNTVAFTYVVNSAILVSSCMSRL